MNPKNLPKKLVGPEEERAVSPVIGVILMVAITVILAAVIAAFVLDIGPGDSTITASADLEADGDSVEIDVTAGGGDMEGLALVDSSGNVIETIDEDVNTGGSYDLANTGLTDGEDEVHSVYGFSGSVDTSIDDANAHVNLGSVELTGQP